MHVCVRVWVCACACIDFQPVSQGPCMVLKQHDLLYSNSTICYRIRAFFYLSGCHSHSLFHSLFHSLSDSPSHSQSQSLELYLILYLILYRYRYLSGSLSSLLSHSRSRSPSHSPQHYLLSNDHHSLSDMSSSTHAINRTTSSVRRILCEYSVQKIFVLSNERHSPLSIKWAPFSTAR